MDVLSLILALTTFAFGIMIARFNQRRSDAELRRKLSEASQERHEIQAALTRLELHFPAADRNVNGASDKHVDDYFMEKLKSTRGWTEDDERRTERLLNEWERTSPTSPRVTVARAEFVASRPSRGGTSESAEAFHRANRDKAEALFRKARETHPTSPYPHWRHGFHLYCYHKPEQAIPALEEACRLSPDTPKYLYYLARCREMTGSPKHALTALDTLLRVTPLHYKALRLRAHLLRSAGDDDGAEAATSLARLADGSWRARWLPPAACCGLVALATCLMSSALV